MSNITADTALREANELLQRGQGNDAFAAAQRALRSRPGDPSALSIMALVSIQRGKHADAEAFIRQALITSPDSADLHCNLGMTYALRGDRDKALQCFQDALNRNKVHTDSWNNAAGLLLERGRLEEATICVINAHQSAPNRPELAGELARLLMMSGRVAEAASCFARCASGQGNNPVPRMNVLQTLHYLSDADPDKVFADHRAFGTWFSQAAPAQLAPLTNDKDPDRCLRIGIICNDFRSPSISSLITPILEHTPKGRMTFVAYSHFDPQPDALGTKLRACFESWIVTRALAAQALADHIRRDKIDILIDLHGLSGGSRLDALLHRPAPVHISYLGYPHSTGLPQIDYRIVDHTLCPTSEQPRTVEKLLHVEGSSFCFQPREDLRIQPVAPRRASEPFTFGAFTGLARISNACAEAWSEILTKAPGSRLLLRNQFLADPGTLARTLDRFKQAGAPEGSVQAAPVNASEGNAAYEQVDLFLDTHPYSGAALICEQLWLGVPVLTWSGQTEASRLGASILSAAGLSDCIATSREQFVNKAVAFAKDPASAAKLRAGLRERVASSPLMDASAFALRFEKCLRGAWKAWATA